MEKDLVTLGVYLFAVRIGGVLCEFVKTSPIVGEIISGALLGPPLANFVPNPDGVMLAGMLGIQLAVIEAGIATPMDVVATLGPRAFLIAVLGILLPIGLSLVAVMGFGGKFLEAFACGAAIAPTSLGVVAKLLKEKNELDTPLGQIISMAAVFDDVLSLILLSFIQKLAIDGIGTWKLVSPIVYAVVFIIGAVAASIIMPRAVNAGKEKVAPDKQAFFCIICLFLFALLLTYLANVAGTSFLLGGYLAGIAFASVGDIIPNVYTDQVKRIMLWMARLFFAGTIAFAIPLKQMFKTESLGLGMILALIGVFGKMLCGIGTYPRLKEDGLAVGVAMLGRGEFGFLIALEASALGLVTQRQYASTIWGVVIPTILTPILFGPIFNWRKKRVHVAITYEEGDADKTDADKLEEDNVGIQA